MYNFVCIGLFILLYIVDVSVQAVSCPTSKNQPVNITRVTDRIFGVTWVKNNIKNGTITNALYNSTTGGCFRPSNNDNYTIYCEKFDNSNNTLYTLEVHQPTEGDVYFTSSDSNDKTTIIFQDPVNIEPDLKDNITLTNDRKTQLKTSITCTPLTPVFTWIIKSRNGLNIIMGGSHTTNETGCDVTKTTLTSTVTISKDTVKIINDPFTVSVQLSYKECDNIYTSQPTPYFTVKNASGDNGVHESDSVPPPYMYIGIGVGGAVLLVIIIIVVILCCCWKRKEKNKDTASKEDIARTSNSRNGLDSPLGRGEIIIDENVEYVSQGGIFSDSVQYAVVNKKTETGRKKDEIIIDENVEYVGLGDAASPPVVPRRGYQGSKPSKRGEEGLKYVDVDFSNQKPATEIRGANRQSTVQYSQIQPKHLQH